MYIKEIELTNYRNYDKIKISFNSRVNIFLGNNAQGKTNLLEGIYLNAMGKSFRTLRDKELVKFDKDYCKIKTISVNNIDEIKTEIIINREGKKGIKLDGKVVNKSSQLLERIFIIIFSPDDLKIVKDEPEKRRRFIDRELCQIRKKYFSDLNDYKKSLKQRNTYLKEAEIDISILDIWDCELAKYAGRVMVARNEFINKINKISSEIHSKISGGKECLQLHYECNIPTVNYNNEKDIEKYYYKILKSNEKEDIKNRNTGKGPHKDDLRIILDGVDLRKFGSQGQQRTAALSLKLSEIKLIEEETGEKPILLLDDVLSELDYDRQSYLINSLGENQLFITTTDISGKVAVSLPEGKVFKISNGDIELEI